MQKFGSKKPGNILSAFKANLDDVLPDKFKSIKKEILHHCDETKLQASWVRLIEAFEKEISLIKEIGPAIVPQVEYSTIVENNVKFPSTVADEIRKRGCVVIRNVVDRDEALKYKEMVKGYINNHKGKIVGFPEDNPQVWEIYWSKAQITARSHPNFVAVTRALNNLWSAAPGSPIDFDNSVTYCDRLRIRQPGDTSFTLGEHMDGGSVERWMSLSTTQPGGGTLRLCPLVKLSASYVMLRPLLKDLLEESSMGGAIPGVQQHILESFHPHIIRAMVSIPEVNPGDCVFWHCDSVHAVEGICNSPTDSSVMYMPAAPLCVKNAECALKQRNAFEAGKSPPDFPKNDCEEFFEDRAMPNDLTKLGRLTMGFNKIEWDQNRCVHQGSEEAIKIANDILRLS
ncbi:uncharacterized protein YbiU-like isoform X2 [Bradysia coprophila]|uniref:uncharacterized protein YbiU-like isoform X2 n=1 Tax=Bradysia coprophila TaxID=38358 RepID=UPI00187DB71F|nr:uncharacterized protein YbiU-like isoform X2 [Bradysia coprophila]